MYVPFSNSFLSFSIEHNFNYQLKFMTPVYRWSGEYFGFISNERLFDKHCKYLGWVDENEVWRSNGTFLGEIIDEHYILRRVNMTPRTARTARTTPITPAKPAFRVNRAQRVQRSGRVDALVEFR
jgi:hypothetical protein